MALFGLSGLAPAGLAALAVTAADKLADGFSFAETLLRGNQAAESASASSDKDAAAEEAQAELESRLAELGKLLSERLAGAGINVSAPIRLQDDGFGGIAVDGDHPDRAAIERLLSTDAELTAAFNSLASDYVRNKATGGADNFDSLLGNESTPYDRLLEDIDRRGFRLTLQGEKLSVDE